VRGRRRAADAWLLSQTPPRPPSSDLDRRAGELVSVRRCAQLARTLHGIEREALGRVVPGPVPLDRRAIRRQLDLVRAVEKSLADSARPVCARGVLLVDRLLTEPGSPLYSRDGEAMLAEALSEALSALEPRAGQIAA